MSDYSLELEFAKRLAKKAGVIMKQYFNQDQQIEIKSDNTPVTIADKQINQMVIDEVKANFPEDGVYGEEASFGKDKDRLWVCDPIDGTMPYTLGIPMAAFSLALVIDGEPILGVAFDPFLDKLFEAELNKGTKLNGEKINVNDEPAKKSVMSFCWFYHSKSKIVNLVSQWFTKKEVSYAKSLSIVYDALLVANGKIDALISLGNRPVDYAAVKIIIEEAGGKTSDLDGKAQKYNQELNGFVCAKPKTHQEIIKMLKDRK